MSDINWKENAVCSANDEQWILNEDKTMLKCARSDSFVVFDWALNQHDFQLNEIKVGDFIPVSELDTEQKYNEVVEVLKLHGVTGGLVEDKYSYQDIVGMFSDDKFIAIHNVENEVCAGFVNDGSFCKRKMFFNQIIAIGKLKRMMLEREKSAPKTAPDLTPDFTKVSSNKYEREITDRKGNSATVDVYDVLKAFNVTCPATQHAVKKLLCSGLRGHKDLQTDLIEAKESIVRAIELN